MSGADWYEILTLIKVKWQEEPLWEDSSGRCWRCDEILAWREIEPFEER